MPKLKQLGLMHLLWLGYLFYRWSSLLAHSWLQLVLFQSVLGNRVQLNHLFDAHCTLVIIEPQFCWELLLLALVTVLLQQMCNNYNISFTLVSVHSSEVHWSVPNLGRGSSQKEGTCLQAFNSFLVGTLFLAELYMQTGHITLGGIRVRVFSQPRAHQRMIGIQCKSSLSQSIQERQAHHTDKTVGVCETFRFELLHCISSF